MFRNILNNPITFNLLLIINIILFTEVISILFLFFPTFLFSYSIFVIVFYFLFTLYFLSSLFIPWIAMFFNNIPNYIFITISTSFLSFIIYLFINSFFKFPLQIIIYFILLKSLMSGLALLFKVISSTFLPNKSKYVSFSFQNSVIQTHKYRITNQINIKFELFGSFSFLILYPILIIFLTYFFT